MAPITFVNPVDSLKLGASAPLVQRHRRHRPRGNRDRVPGMAALSCAQQRALGNHVRKVARGGGRGGSCDGGIVSGAQAALESFRPLAQHPQERLFLSAVELAVQAIEQFRLVDEKLDVRLRAALGFDGGCGEPGQPERDFVIFVGCFERIVVSLALEQYRRRQSRQRRMTERLGEGLLRNGAANASVAVLEWMDGLEVQVRYPCSRQGRQGVGAAGGRAVEPVHQTSRKGDAALLSPAVSTPWAKGGRSPWPMGTRFSLGIAPLTRVEFNNKTW